MKNALFKTILESGLMVGTLDIAAAFIQSWAYGGNPIRVLKFIASGAFGKEAIDGAWQFGLYGLLFHYSIAMSWTTFFFLIYPRMKFLSKNRILTGVGYGLLVWAVMNQVVLPLSKVVRGPFRLTSALIAAAILIVAIGTPLSFLARRFYVNDSTP